MSRDTDSCKQVPNTTITIVLFVAEVDTRRIAYLCESVQEELKLESSYNKV